MAATIEANVPQPIAGPMPDTPEWHEAHRTHITATDIAPILGCSDYKTAFDVFCEKTGRVAPFEGNEHTRRGQRYEKAILADYTDVTGWVVESPLPLYFSQLGFLAATPDGMVPGCEAQGIPDNGVEAKFSMSSARAVSLGDEGTDDIPDDWLLQTQAQMAVMGWLRVDLAVLLYGRLRIYQVHRNDDLITIIESAAKEMYERVQADDPPELDWEHPNTPRLVKGLYGIKEGLVVELPHEAEAIWIAYQEIGSEIKRRGAERESLKARILHAMGEAEIGSLPGIGLELVRRQIERQEYVVKASSYTTLRERKART